MAISSAVIATSAEVINTFSVVGGEDSVEGIIGGNAVPIASYVLTYVFIGYEFVAIDTIHTRSNRSH